MNNELIYLYCISDSPLGIVRNVKPTYMESLKFDDFYAIVKYVSDSEFSEDNFKIYSANNQWVETNAREHMRVIGMIMEYSTVIPFKFGTIYHTNAGLQKFITDYSVSLIANFDNVRGKEEWAVKVYCNRKALYNQIDELSEAAADLEKQIMASSPGKAFLLGIKKTALVDNEMDRLCEDYGQKYYDEFKSLSEYTCLSSLLSKENTGRAETMILNAAFLVRKDKVPDLKWTFNTLRKKDENYGFSIEATGPLPPFSFISIKEIQ
jgi:hypothetical protein